MVVQTTYFQFQPTGSVKHPVSITFSLWFISHLQVLFFYLLSVFLWYIL